MKKRINLIISFILICITIINYLLAKFAKGFFFSFYPYVSNFCIKILSIITSITKFSLWEIIAGLIVVYLIISLIKTLKTHEIGVYITKIILVICIFATSFVNIWGLNYFSEDLYKRLGYSDKQYDVNELYKLTEYLVIQANKYADLVERDENNRMISNVDEYNEIIFKGFKPIKQDLKFFNNTAIRVKTLISSKYFSLRGVTGIFICLTGESSITDSVYTAAIPLTMCHEIAHRNSIAREDEANFIGFLAAMNNDDVRFKYSAYFEAFLYAATDLLNTNAEVYEPIRYMINDNLRFDILDNSGFYQEKTDKEKEEANNDFYNSYLHTFEVENGVASYGDMVKLLLCWYFEEIN